MNDTAQRERCLNLSMDFPELTAYAQQITLETKFSENKSKHFAAAIHFTANNDKIGWSIIDFFIDLKIMSVSTLLEEALIL